MTTLRPAQFVESDLVMPKPTWLAVVTTLRNFAIITYAVNPSDLAKLLPDGFEPELFDLENGSKCALISAVPFQDIDFRFNSCPWPQFSFGQTNYRAYVLYKGKRIAWFFGTSLATPFVLVPRNVWLLPWHHASMRFNSTWQNEICKHYELKTTGSWGNAEVLLEGTDEPAGCLDGFSDADDAAVILTHPLIGYYRRRDGKVGTYSVWHDKLSMRRAICKTARFDVFIDLGLVKPDQAPHSVLIQYETEFTIMLPPRLVNS
jgi:uncharacterized protein YqjF (DUF2071 family)